MEDGDEFSIHHCQHFFPIVFYSDSKRGCDSDLRYRKVEGSDPSSPTIILLPGGPGQISIGDDSWIPPDEHHIKSQFSAPMKIFITFEGAGHGVLSMMSGCAIQIWKSIAGDNLANLSQSLDQCEYNYQMEVETQTETRGIGNE